MISHQWKSFNYFAFNKYRRGKMPVLPEKMAFYQRHLPHWQPKNAEFFITFRLAGSLPKQAINKLQSYRKQAQENKEHDQDYLSRKIIQKYEDLLDKAETGPTWLGRERLQKQFNMLFTTMMS